MSLVRRIYVEKKAPFAVRAKELASEGKSYIDILKFFYKDCKVEHV